MTLRIYNSLGHRKEPFEPLEPAHVRMYVCGVTVYDECHIGHARSAIVFDVIYRYLLHCNYKVTYVRNFTDVDDKIIDRARVEGLPWDRLARKYIRTFHRDMDALGILRPTIEPLATEHVQEMIEAIQGLESRGLAYTMDGSVYFAVQRFNDYGKLSGRNREELMAGARIEIDERKRDPLDFALWKRSRPDEPAWPSPWGDGRPGWHIECSVMSQKYLGETFDIHGGGLDLLFPHHENEITQAEGLTGKPFARYWIHNGPLTREGVKMSKSLGNILSIQDALDRYHPEELRLFMLTSHYRKPLDFSAEGMAESQTALDRLYSTVQRLDRMLNEHPPADPPLAGQGPAQGPGRGLAERVEAFDQRFQEAMDDDFNTAAALAQLFDLNRVVNQWLDDPSFSIEEQTPALLSKARECYRTTGAALGLLALDPEVFFHQKEDLALKKIDLSRSEVERLVSERTSARQRKAWAEADRIRDELLRLGIQVLDTSEGTRWKFRPGIRSSG
jgi:cysteinyl-tRNA synthetase